MQLGALEYLISVNTKGVQDGINKSESLIKKGAKSTENALKGAGNKLSAWTLAKAQVLANYTQKALSTLSTLAKSTTKEIVKSYGSFEQLEGGIKKLFGENVQKEVIKNAKLAYKTAGMSANAYLENVVGFSASLIDSLKGDTKEAAKYADMAIQDMADNINTFGRSAEEVENAYRGFAKGQFNMLDNLSLGYQGTRKEMERLLKDAGKIAGKKFNIGNLADIYDAIHIIQDKKLGITGTTEKEAKDTIEGSIASAKAAWQNVLTEAGKGNWDFKYYVRQFTGVAKNVVKNIKPVAVNAIKGLFTIAKELLPEIGSFLKDILHTAKISLADMLGLGEDASWAQIVEGVGEKLKGGIKKAKIGIATLLGIEDADEATWSTIATKILTNISKHFGEGGFLGKLLEEGTSIIDEVANFAAELISGIVTWLSDSNNLTPLINAFETVGKALIEGIKTVLSSPDVWNSLAVLAHNLLVDIVGGEESVIGKMLGGKHHMEQTASGTKIVDSNGEDVGTTGMDIRDKVISGYVAYRGYKVAKPMVDKLLHATSDTATSAAGTTQIAKEATTEAMQNLNSTVDDLLAHSIEDTGDDFARGVAESTDDVARAAADVSDDVARTVADASDDVVKTFGQTVKDGISNVKNAVGNKAIQVGTSFNPMTFFNNAAMGDALVYGTDFGGAIMNTVSKWLTGEKSDARDDLGEFFERKSEEIEEYAKTFFSDNYKIIGAWMSGGDTNSLEYKVAEAAGELGDAYVKKLGDKVAKGIATATYDVVEGYDKAKETFNNVKKVIDAWSAITTRKTVEVQFRPVYTGYHYTSDGMGKIWDGFMGSTPFSGGGGTGTSWTAETHAKGSLNVPYNMVSELHQGEMVLTKSQARKYREGDGVDSGAIVSAIQGLRNDMTNLKLVVGRKVFGRAVADYGGEKVNDYIGGAESRLAAGYGT